MKLWISEALESLNTHRNKQSVSFSDKAEWGEYQIRIWFRNSIYFEMGKKEDSFVKACIASGVMNLQYYCWDCYDTGCLCGGIGLSCHGCCPCEGVGRDRYHVLVA